MSSIPAVSYRRVSTEDQEAGYSLPKQLEYNQTYALNHGLEIVKDFFEDISGKVPIRDRGEGAKMLSFLQSRRALALIVHEADRLSRDIVDLLAMVQQLLRDGIQVHIADVGFVQSELDIALVIRAWQGGAEHQRITDRLMRGKLGKAESGKWVGGTPPYGYRSIGTLKTARMVIHEAEAEIVRSIYRWYTTERLSMLAIADRLNLAGVPTQRGAQWWKEIIKKIISNETYIGVVYYAGIRIDLPELAIIDAETFSRAQELRRVNRERASRNRKHEYLLSNHIRCGCGSTMTGAVMSLEYQRVYYRCSQFQLPATIRTCGLGVPFAAGVVVDDIVWRHVCRLITDADFLRAAVEEVNAAREQQIDNEAELTRLDRQISSAGRRIDRLLREFGDDEDSDVVKATRAAVRDAQRERDEARVRRDMLLSAQQEKDARQTEQASILDTVRQWRGLIDDADFEFRRDVLQALDMRVVFDEDSGGRCIWVGTALSLPARYEYVNARQYKKRVS